MIAYGISILPLIKNLKQDISDIPKPCYTDDSGSLGTFSIIETYFDSLIHQARDGGITPNRPRVY